MTLTFTVGPSSTACRTYSVDACDPVTSTSNSVVPIDPSATFQIRQRDALDFTVDWTDVLSSMGDSVTIAEATFAAPSGSPKTPLSVVGGFDPAGHVRFVLTPAANAAPGDIYYVDVTITTSASTLPLAPSVTIPARTVVRRMQFQVVPG